MNQDAQLNTIVADEIIASAVIRVPCNAPAPLVLNGGAYVGCSRDKHDDDNHEVTIKWTS